MVAEKFVPGDFGKNFVFKYMNERNVCIGDVFAVGDDGAVLQVSLPRQPCYKLNPFPADELCAKHLKAESDGLVLSMPCRRSC